MQKWPQTTLSPYDQLRVWTAYCFITKHELLLVKLYDWNNRYFYSYLCSFKIDIRTLTHSHIIQRWFVQKHSLISCTTLHEHLLPRKTSISLNLLQIDRKKLTNHDKDPHHPWRFAHVIFAAVRVLEAKVLNIVLLSGEHFF